MEIRFKLKKIKGLQFRRQRPIGNYIADFACLENKVIIEIDGGTHNSERVFKNDKPRTENLEKMGFKTIRFSDEEILKNIDGVKKYLETIL